jgi:predicted acetyltransferase
MEPFVYLTRPVMELESDYLSFYQEWKESGENMVPWVLKKDPTNFQEMIQFLLDSEKAENLKEGLVPCSTFWLINENKNVIGAVNIRHRLNEKLLNSGGHIGYGIRPSERQKGYATKLLALSLEKAKEIGIQKALVVCDDGNIGSEKTILNNGGIPDKDYIEEDGNIIKRFWIDIK